VTAASEDGTRSIVTLRRAGNYSFTLKGGSGR